MSFQERPRAATASFRTVPSVAWVRASTTIEAVGSDRMKADPSLEFRLHRVENG